MNIPLGPLAHLEELVYHIIDRSALLLWCLSHLLKKLSHLLTILSNGLWNTINANKFSRKKNFISSLLDNKERLSLVSHLQLVSLVEVLGDRDLLSILHLDKFIARSVVKVNILNDVNFSISIVGDD